MPTIEIPDEQFTKLSDQAAAAGFEDVAEYIQSLAAEAAFDPRSGMMEVELRQSAAECRQINERMKAAGGRDAREALAKLGQKYGLKMPS